MADTAPPATKTLGCTSCGRHARRRVATIARPADTLALVGWVRRYDDIRVALLSLPVSENARLEESLKADYFACGCVEGRRALAITVGLVVAAGILFASQIAGDPVSFILAALSAIVLAPLVTMLIVVASARRRLAARIRALQRA